MARNAGGSRALGAYESERRQADARGIPASIMMPRVLLLVSTALLVLIGLVMVFSASTVEAISQGDGMFEYVGKQAVYAALGCVAGLVASRVPFQMWRGFPFAVVWAACMLLLLAVACFGTEILGAKRWLMVGPFSIQPSEFAKIAFIMGAVRIFYEYAMGESDWKRMLRLAIVLIVVPVVFLSKTQNDFGSAIVIFIGVVSVLWIGEAPRRWIAALFALVAFAGILVVGTGFRAARVETWLDPWSDEYGTGYQVIRSFYAFSEGGLFGVGLGNSREKFLYLPEAETDYIFSIIGEELGLVGTLSVIVLFLVFLYAGFQIAAAAPDGFGRMLAGGLTSMLVGQAFLNMACVTGLFPTTGKPLPFISSGGSSIIASLIIVGLVYGVSRGSNELTPYERRRNNLNVLRVEQGERGTEHAEASGRTRRGARDASVSGRLDMGALRGSTRNAARNSGYAGRGAGAARNAGRSGRIDGSGGSRRSAGSSAGLRDAGPMNGRDGGRGSGFARRPSDINLGTGTDRSYYEERTRSHTGSRKRERGRR